MAYDMSDWSPPGGYGTWSPALPYLEFHSPLMWYGGQDSLDTSWGNGGRINPRPVGRLRTSLIVLALSLSALHLVLL